MNTRRKTARRVGEDIENAGATSHGNRNAPQVKAATNDQVLVNPPAITDGEVGDTMFQVDQAITTQDQAITAHAKREVVPRENKHASTMASHFREFMRMNPLIYFG